MQPVRTSVELPCRVIGTAPTASWSFNGKPYAPKQLDNQLPAKQVASSRPASGSKVAAKSENLVLADLKTKDSGNYTCSTKNGESVTHQLIVLGSHSGTVAFDRVLKFR